MKKFILIGCLFLCSLAALSQQNAIIVSIPDPAATSTRFWPAGTIVYVVSTSQFMRITADWPVATTFNSTSRLPADPGSITTATVTVFDDVTSAGSGAIITALERTKLTSVESGAEANVQSDWNEANNGSDAFILNKPTVFNTEGIQDIIGEMVGNGSTQTGITVTYDDGTGKLNFNVTSMLVPPTIPVFNIQGQSTSVNPGTTLSGSQTFIYSITNPESVSGNLTLSQGASVLSSSVSPTGSSVVATINDVTLTNPADNVVFELSGTDLNSANFSATFTVTAVSTSEFFYHGLSQDPNPSNFDITTSGSEEITGDGQTGTITIGPTTLNDRIILLAPTDHDLVGLVNTGHGQDVLSTYTKTLNARTIAGQTYNAFVYNFPTNAGFTVTYTYTLE